MTEPALPAPPATRWLPAAFRRNLEDAVDRAEAGNTAAAKNTVTPAVPRLLRALDAATAALADLERRVDATLMRHRVERVEGAHSETCGGGCTDLHQLTVCYEDGHILDDDTQCETVRILTGVEDPDGYTNPIATAYSQLADWTEAEYVRACNAVLASPSDTTSDALRWRGMADAWRQVAARCRELAGQPVPNYTSKAWRDTHGVYNEDALFAMHRGAR